MVSGFGARDASINNRPLPRACWCKGRRVGSGVAGLVVAVACKLRKKEVRNWFIVLSVSGLRLRLLPSLSRRPRLSSCSSSAMPREVWFRTVPTECPAAVAASVRRAIEGMAQHHCRCGTWQPDQRGLHYPHHGGHIWPSTVGARGEEATRRRSRNCTGSGPGQIGGPSTPAYAVGGRRLRTRSHYRPATSAPGCRCPPCRYCRAADGLVGWLMRGAALKKS